MKVIFIGGASASGKTTLAKQLAIDLEEYGVACKVLPMDNYFLEIPDGVEINHYRANTNFDRIEMYDNNLLKEHILALYRGESVNEFIFEFTTNKRRYTGDKIQNLDFLIVEGLFALSFAKELPMIVQRLTAFTSTDDYRAIIKSRIERDTTERGRSAEEVKRQESKYVGPAFFKVIARSKNGVNIDITNASHEENKPHPLKIGSREIIDELINKAWLSNRLDLAQDSMVRNGF